MHLIDIGALLTHDSFDHHRDAVIGRARSVGVETMVVTGARIPGVVEGTGKEG